MQNSDKSKANKSGYTPMMEQYLAAKQENPEALLFFRMGDFYEMFFDDAITASQALEIVLTARESAGEKVPMCGVPHHSASSYIARLIKQGFKVAICEQVEDPRKAIGIVRREVVRVITPGTVLEDFLLDEDRNNYLASIYQIEDRAGIAYLDVSTGDFFASLLNGPGLVDGCCSELLRIQAVECLLGTDEDFAALLCGQESLEGIVFDQITDWPGGANGQSANGGMFEGRQNALESEPDLPSECRRAAEFLLDFVARSYRAVLAQIKCLRLYRPEKHMALDSTARKNLELINSLQENRKNSTLFNVLNHCKTAMGQRMLRRWIEEPLLDAVLINRRLDAVEELKNGLELHEKLTGLFKGVYDIERLCGRLGGNIASPRDLSALRQSLQQLPAIQDLCRSCQSPMMSEIVGHEELDDLRLLLNAAISENAPTALKDGGVIRNGFDPLIDELRNLAGEGQDWLLEYELREKERTGIRHLKIGYNRVFGYYIDISKASLGLVPDNYIRRQTLANNERYITPELKEFEDRIMNSGERLQEQESLVFQNIVHTALQALPQLQTVASLLAGLDTVASLARAAFLNDYVRPQFTAEPGLEIKSGRHPVVEKNLKDGRFVPNDLTMDNSRQHFALITGPNMGGKSTFMRQTALIVLMAQMGSFVPARSARLGLFDRICTRVGASDDLSGGHSTFMLEMVEVASIIRNATPYSLVLLDEVGRGTSTYDGLSIAQALCEHMCSKNHSFVLFATHYHELTALDEQLSGFFNISVSVLESGSQVTFLKRVLPGKADKSYGIHVARMADLPASLVERAETLLTGMEQNRTAVSSVLLEQPGLFDAPKPDHPVVQEIRRLDTDALSPREALLLLYQWKDRV